MTDDAQYLVYRLDSHPKPNRVFYDNKFRTRQKARLFCRNRIGEEGLTIVHPDGTREAY